MIHQKKTLELTDCTISYLMGYLEGKFTEGMTWENHGLWHIDHIKPCASFNLLIEDEDHKNTKIDENLYVKHLEMLLFLINNENTLFFTDFR